MTTRLSLGPLLYYWPRDRVLDFYQRIAETAVDIVYLGETVCAKRRALRLRDWIEIGTMLEESGKTVVLSSLTLLEAHSEMRSLEKLCANDRFMVEANDMAAVQLLSGRSRFVTGPAINIYNSRSLAVLARAGLHRWTLPVELSRDTLAVLHRERPEGVETEVFAFGRLPLAYSARCFTARSLNLAKDDCQLRCLDYPDGRLLRTQEDRSFLVLNGIQTQSAKTHNLIGDTDDLMDMQIDVLRISPQSRHTERIIDIFHRRLHGALSAAQAAAQLQSCLLSGACDGYWHGRAGMDQTREYA